MFDLIKKTLLTGVGLAVMTKDKVEELGKEFASQAKLSELEGKEFVDHLLKQSETARKEFRDPDQLRRAESRLGVEPGEQGRGGQALGEGRGTDSQAAQQQQGNEWLRRASHEVVYFRWFSNMFNRWAMPIQRSSSLNGPRAAGRPARPDSRWPANWSC